MSGHRVRIAVMALCVAIPGCAFAQSDVLTFPKDDGVHKSASFEMWSGFAHVKSRDGARYSVLAFFFTGRVMGIGMSGVYGVVMDTESGRIMDNRDLVTPIFGSSQHTAGRLDERYDRNRLVRDGGQAPYAIDIATDRLQLQLTLEPTRDPVDLGNVVAGEGRTQRSYVVPHAKVEGRLSIEGSQTVAVAGQGIFQHVWGDSPDKSAAQDIIAIHLDDGTDLFVMSGVSPESATVMVADDGGAAVLRSGFRLEADTTITAGALMFRRQWRLQITAPFRSLRISPSSAVRQVSLLGVPYLIVRCAVRGEGSDEQPLSGVAYMYVRGRTSGGSASAEGALRVSKRESGLWIP